VSLSNPDIESGGQVGGLGGAEPVGGTDGDGCDVDAHSLGGRGHEAKAGRIPWAGFGNARLVKMSRDATCYTQAYLIPAQAGYLVV
jgi:hypothetical protein